MRIDNIRALEIVHAMAGLLLKSHGEITLAANPAEACDALDTVASLIRQTKEIRKTGEAYGSPRPLVPPLKLFPTERTG
jgi:hypothetical protein